jgi:folate-binding protein YgfZ
MLDIDGAVEAAWPDEGVAAHYGDPLREQRVAAERGALVDRSNRGVVTITGPDRLSWLHSLTSQHLERLVPGQTAQALILSPQGHLEHHLTLADDGTTVWAHVEPGTAPALAAYLNSMRFMLRVEVADLSATHGVVSFLRETDVADGPALPDFPSLAGAVLAEAPAVTTGAFGLDMVVALDRLGEVAGKPGVPLAGMWAYEAARIAAHVPRPGLDTDHKTLPHEAGLIETAVHLNKGCYRGQETVARVHNLGHPPRRLVFLHLDGGADRLPAHGAPIVDPEGREVGFAGSAARHYELGPVGLGLVKRTVPTGATLLADGVAAAQEVIVAPDAGGAVKVTLRRDSVPPPPPAARRLL